MNTATRSRRSTVQLLEDVQQTRGKLRVDMDAGIIYNAKFLGFISPNRHGRVGVRRTRYKREAVATALHLYEGRQIYKNHPDKREALAERKFDDLLGELFDCRLESDGGYANIRVIKGDPDTEKLLRVAQQMPHLIGLSHNADGRGYVDDRTEEFLIESIPVVRSVDVVTRPATTENLLESRERTVAGKKKTLKQILESRGWKKTSEIIALLEDDALGMDAASPIPEPAVPEEGADPLHWREHLKNAVKAVLDDDTLSEPDVKKAINSILATLKTGEEGGETSESGEDDEEEEEEGEGKKKPAMESKEEESIDDLRAKVTRLETEKACVKLCESMEFAPSTDQIDILADLPTDTKRKVAIEGFAASKKPGGSDKPVTGAGAKNRQRTSTLESKNGPGDKPAANASEFVNRITGGRVTVATK